VTEVLVDIGTGYFVSKPIPKAAEFLDRKVGAPTRLQRASHAEGYRVVAGVDDMGAIFISSASLAAFATV
jgi:hypothetical protein